MLISKENAQIRDRIFFFDKRIEAMHQAFYKYYNGIDHKVPDWEDLERELIIYSRKKIIDLELSNNFERILLKFQNRKKIWMAWLEESHHSGASHSSLSR